MLIVQQVLKGQTIYSLAQQFNISKDIIKRWVHNRYNKQSMTYKLTEEHVQFEKNK